MDLLLYALLFVVVVYVLTRFALSGRRQKAKFAHLPDRFVVFDLETTGLDPDKHEIIEIGAIRVNRGSEMHETFQSLVIPTKGVPRKITEITGINQKMIEADGQSIEKALKDFLDFIGDLPLVAFNAEFDMSFLRRAADMHSLQFKNQVSCALKMSRRAWPGRKSYRLTDLAKDGNQSNDNTHRALGDSQRTLIVYVAAASTLGTIS